MKKRELDALYIRNEENLCLATETPLLSSYASAASPDATSPEANQVGQTEHSNGTICNPVVYRIGIYGWRKRFLYALLILITCLIFINAALTIWIIRELNLSLAGMGKISLNSRGIILNGDAFIHDALHAKFIRSRKKSILKLQSNGNITINSRKEMKNDVVNRLLLTPSLVELFTNDFKVKGTNGRLLFGVEQNLNTEEVNIIVAADKLQINRAVGIKFNASLQTPMLQSDPFESLKLESTTRSINIKGPQGVAIESLTGDITATSLQDLTLRSRIGKITLDASNIELRSLETASPSSEGTSYPEVYQLCACAQNGRLFMSPSNGSCYSGSDLCNL